jgi:hypothetical protein
MKTWLVVASLLLPVTAVDAQQPGNYGRPGSYGGYTPPAGPTLSPRLNFFRRDPGPVGRYLSFVRPGLQLERTLQQQQTSLTELSSDFRTTTSQQPAIPPTGASSVFQNYQRYFRNEASFYQTRGQFSR